MKSSDSVIYCDNHLLVANKPSLWLTQPDGSSTPDLEGHLKEWIKNKFHKPGAVFLHAVHRLDRPVSGLVLFARTSKALSRLNEQVRTGAIHRNYVAEVEGSLSENEGWLEHFLVHGDRRAIIVSKAHPLAKKARLHYQIKARKQGITRVYITLETGRYHQIRAQFAAIGHPIIGDVRYGAQGTDQTIHLHCSHLAFQHPVTKEELQFDCAALF